MKPKTLQELLTVMFKAKLPVLIKGAPGVGKSDIVASAAKDAGFDLIVSHPVVSDPTDFKGLPFPNMDKSSADFLPFGDLKRLIEATVPTVFFLDDLGQAPMSVQAACMQLLLARMINNHKVSDEVVFVAATNRRKDKAGVMGILEPVKSRFSSIVELEADLDDWIAWASHNNMPPELMSFIRWKPDFLHKFDPTGDIVNQPCPRTIAYVGKIMNVNPSKTIRQALIGGAAGDGFAAEFEAYLQIYLKLPSLSSLIARADSIEVPTEPSLLYAYCGFIAANNSVQNYKDLSKFINRMPEEYQILTIRDTINGKHPGISKTMEYATWAMNHAEVVL